MAAVTGLDGKGLAALARLAEAFDVAGKVGPDAPMLVLRFASDAVFSDPSQEVNRLVADLRSIFQGPVLVVPYGWTQAEIDAEAVRLAVKEEREACAKLAKSLRLVGPNLAPAMADYIADAIRARGQP